MKIQLIALDLDGTLLMEDHMTVSEGNKKALKMAHDKGIEIVISSGRPIGGLDAILDQIPFIDYAVTANGATVVRTKDKEVIYHEGIPYEVWSDLYPLLMEYNTRFRVYMDGEVYMEDDEAQKSMLEDTLVKGGQLKVNRVHDLPEVLKGKSIEKINVVYTPEEYYDVLRAKFEANTYLAVTSSIAGNMELNWHETNKGTGLKHLCDVLGFSMEHVMAFGDADNDLEMMKVAGYSFAMGNANENVKRHAKYETKTNVEDGVAYAVLKYI